MMGAGRRANLDGLRRGAALFFGSAVVFPTRRCALRIRALAIPAASVLLLLAPAAAAQSVLVVDDDGGVPYTTIQDAIDAAVFGDIVLVHPGTYDPFTISAKTAVIHSATATRPFVLGPVVIEDLAASDHVSIKGLEINEAPSVFFGITDPVLLIENCAGPVWIEKVATNPAPTSISLGRAATGTRVLNCGSVAFADCDLEAFSAEGFGYTFNAGLHSGSSTVAVYDSRLRGADGNTFDTVYDGGPGLRVDGGDVFVSGCDVSGGPGVDGFDDFPSCTGFSGSNGGPGCRLLGDDPQVEIVDSVFAGAPGGLPHPTTSCSGGQPGLPGAPTVVDAGQITNTAGTAKSMTTASPVREGDTITETVTADPGDFAVLVFTLAHIPATPIPDTVGPALVGFPAWFQRLGIVDPSGEIVFTLPNVGILPPQFEYAILYKQLVTIDPTFERVIGSPSLLMFLGTGF